MLENQVMADAVSNEQIPTLELSIIMPCLNEAETLATCIGKARDYLERHKIAGEVLIADNGSSDGSREIATNSGVRVVPIPERGYGSALRGGIAAAKGQYIIMGDADDSYDFTNLSPFLEKLRQGYDLVMGNRFQGGIKPGAMPVLHKHLGNPVLTWLGRLFFGSPCGDFHCGLRGFSKQAIEQLNLRTTGMEFASEMVVKASLYGLKITEVPTTLSPDGRSRPPHLKTWRDGWRHLRFLLMYSPRWLFLYPGLALMFLGFVATIWFIPQPKVHTLLYSATALIIGFQIVSFAVFTKAFAISEGLLPEDRKLRRFLRYINLEVGLIIGVILFLLGMGGSLYALYIWNARLYGALDPAVTMRIVIPSVTALALGVQVVFSSFFLSVLGLKRK
ncbi:MULTISPECIES: glycosyltransferase family 2 protein [Microcystis]|uniref:Glycosyltransferase n=1 Tax=Microcystis aeruginosa DA14 TaxID=1987506 RepID=A0A3E0MA30_MICAE|nr:MULTISPECIES: glycosyltransferase family 2 protein [Microcystis]REJ56457.1 MAG: glycosyltransferase [Microcystis aeruginosa DA14]TRU09354.1 MAG: glycosyltransferase [Microcystis sp. Msp_OC_L_20101000_S702]CCI07830.1 putative glycosyl transferase [Microcystis aeruginosa PCC 7941]